MQRGRYSADELDKLAEVVRKDGFVILKNAIPVSKILAIREAYAPVLQARVERAGADRGSNRFYATPPFVPPFFDPEIFQDPDILGIMKRLVGEDCVMCQWAADTPMKGSEYQDVHRDAAPLFPELTRGKVFPEPPETQMAVNFPLCDVLPPTDGRLSNGPVEIARGTHRLTVEEGQALINSGKLKLEPGWMAVGDVMIRDVRGLHRGTPNFSDSPREMIVIGYSRAWLNRPEVGLRVKRSLYEGLDDEGRMLLRFEHIVDDSEFGEYPGEGWSPTYDAATLQKASGDSFGEALVAPQAAVKPLLHSSL